MAVQDAEVGTVQVVGKGAVFDLTQLTDHSHITVLHRHGGQGHVAQRGHGQVAASCHAAGPGRSQGDAVLLRQTALLHLKDRAQAGLITA